MTPTFDLLVGPRGRDRRAIGLSDRDCHGIGHAVHVAVADDQLRDVGPGEIGDKRRIGDGRIAQRRTAAGRGADDCPRVGQRIGVRIGRIAAVQADRRVGSGGLIVSRARNRHGIERRHDDRVWRAVEDAVGDDQLDDVGACQVGRERGRGRRGRQEDRLAASGAAGHRPRVVKDVELSIERGAAVERDDGPAQHRLVVAGAGLGSTVSWS